MILTTCAACAAPLAYDAPHCVRCWVRYCDKTCRLPRSDWLEAIEVAEDVVTTSRRVMGTSHPLTTHFQEMLERAKELVRIATSTPADASASPEPVDGPADPAPAKS